MSVIPIQEPKAKPALDPGKKAMLLGAVAQLDTLVMMFQDAPENVRGAAIAFRDELVKWANA
jgi:hypothetical protein